MMKYIVMVLFTVGFLYNIQAQVPSDKIVGIWVNEDKTSKIEFYKVNGTYSGKIVWLETSESNPNLHPKDVKNPNSELRNRNILGMDVITGLQYSGDKWTKGIIYTPKKGMYADCKVELLPNGQLKIIASKSGIKKTQIWIRK